MEFLSHLWWAVPVFAGLVVTIIIRKKVARKRAEAQYRQDESTIRHFASDLDNEDIETYKALRNEDSRFAWLQKHHPEFLDAADRHDSDTNDIVALDLDLKLVRGAFWHDTPEQALAAYKQAGARISLNQYEEIVAEHNEAERKWEEERRIREAKRAEEERKRRAKRAEEERKRRAEAEKEARKRKDAAQARWNALPEDTKKKFKAARGRSERERIIGRSSGYDADVLTPLIMATYFGSVSSSTSSSIDACQSSSYSSSSYSGGSSYSSSSSYDSGSSYSSSDSGGGGGGGCD